MFFLWLFSFQIYIPHTFFINREKNAKMWRSCSFLSVHFGAVTGVHWTALFQSMNLWTDNFMKYNSAFYHNIILIQFTTQFFCRFRPCFIFLYGDRDVHAHFHPPYDVASIGWSDKHQIRCYWVQSSPSEISPWVLLLGSGFMIYSQGNSFFGLLICLLIVDCKSAFKHLSFPC